MTPRIAKTAQHDIKLHGLRLKVENAAAVQADDAIGSSLHRGNVFRVRMNDDPANPRIVEILATLKKSDLIRPRATVAI